MHSKIIELLCIILSFLPFQATALERDSTESYMSMDIQPLCTSEGQIKVVFTNVSGTKLLVDPFYGNADLFDAKNQLILLATENYAESVQLWKLKNATPTSDLTLFMPGQSVEHIVNFRAHNPSIDITKRYVAMTSSIFNVITEDGKTIRVSFDSLYHPNELLIEPDCFK
jgi:hypothetical protein